MRPEELRAELERSIERRRASGEAVSVAFAEAVAPPDQDTEAMSRELRRAAEGFVRRVRKEVFGTADPPGATDPGPVAAEELEPVVRELHRVTGFEESAITDWIYTGTLPKLAKVRVRAVQSNGLLSDGTQLPRRKEVTITLHAPISDAEIRSIGRFVKRLWEVPRFGRGASAEARAGGRRRRKQVTELDLHLDAIVAADPDVTWAERLEEWKANAPKGWSRSRWARKVRGLTPDALRMRWKRLDRKKAELWGEEPA